MRSHTSLAANASPRGSSRPTSPSSAGCSRSWASRSSRPRGCATPSRARSSASSLLRRRPPPPHRPRRHGCARYSALCCLPLQHAPRSPQTPRRRPPRQRPRVRARGRPSWPREPSPLKPSSYHSVRCRTAACTRTLLPAHVHPRQVRLVVRACCLRTA